MFITKLGVGSIIEVHGWIMLSKLEPGQYKVVKMTLQNGKPAYWFSRPKGKKIIVGHYVSSVDSAINSNGDNNYIEIVA